MQRLATGLVILLFCLSFPIALVYAAVMSYQVTYFVAPSDGFWFAGYEWEVRTWGGDPGPNNWAEGNAWVDGSGYLHLTITKVGSKWYCSEVDMLDSLGFGTYTWTVEGRIDQLDKNVVLGLFNYGDQDGADEIDIEVARWGNDSWDNGNFGVYPDNVGTPQQSSTFEFSLPSSLSTHQFVWTSTSVRFTSWDGAGRVIGSWIFSPSSRSAIPQHALTPMLNLWLFEGRAPSDGKPVEVVIRSFEYKAG